jgi:hypothetical protein
LFWMKTEWCAFRESSAPSSSSGPQFIFIPRGCYSSTQGWFQARGEPPTWWTS